MSSPAPPQAFDAFLLFNGADESLIRIIDVRLRERGIKTWFAPRSLKGTASGTSSFESDGALSEDDALNSARVCVVFLGPAGWGPNHRENTSSALAQRKPLIRVLVGNPPPEALALFGLFVGKPPLEFRNPK